MVTRNLPRGGEAEVRVVRWLAVLGKLCGCVVVRESGEGERERVL